MDTIIFISIGIGLCIVAWFFDRHMQKKYDKRIRGGGQPPADGTTDTPRET